MSIYVIKGTDTYVKGLEEYTNGIVTTGGFYTFDKLEKVHKPVIGITYNADACVELPFSWLDDLAIDDRGERQHIRQIDYDNQLRPFIMEDGYKSTEVIL